jgi:hypothetical protein
MKRFSAFASFVLIYFLIVPIFAFADICSRNILVVQEAEHSLGKKCDQIVSSDLSSVKELDLDYRYAPEDYPRNLTAGDLLGFDGLELLDIVLAGKKTSYSIPVDLLENIPQIKSLHISDRGVAPPPEFFKNLSKLEALSLQTFGSGDLKEILALLPQLKKLTVVDATISYNEGYKLFGSSAKLEKLALYSNTLPGWVPADLFDGLSSLKELKFSVYEIATTSKGTLHKDLFSKLTQLEKLELSVSTVPRLEHELLSQNTELKELFVSAEKLKEIPADFFKTLTKLESLTITGWWNLREFPVDMLANQKQLKKLSAYRFLGRGNNGLLPTFLKGLTQLQEINLSNNALTSIPLEIFEDVSADSTIDLGWGNDLPLATKKALKAKYPKMKFTFD